MSQGAKFSGWFDDLLNTGLKILPQVLSGGGPSAPQAPHPSLGGARELDQIGAQQHQLEAQIGIGDAATIFAQMQALQSALSNPQFFDQSSRSENAAYLAQMKDYFAHNLPIFQARLAGQAPVTTPVVTTDPATGQLITTQQPITQTVAAPTDLIPGVPNVYLLGGAAGLAILLTLLKR